MYHRSRSFFDLCPVSLRFHWFRMAFALKPLDRLKSDYILSLHETKGSKFNESFEVTWPKMAIYGKNFKKSVSLEPNGWCHWNLVYNSIEHSGTTKFENPRLTFDLFIHTIMILSFRTDWSRQTVQTQIRLFLEEQSDQGLHWLQFRLHLLGALLFGKAILFKF